MDALKSATADLASAAGFADAAVQFLTLSLDAASGHVITNEQATRANEAALRGIGAAARDVASAQAAQADAADKSTEATDKFGAGSKEAEAAQRDYDNAVAAVSDSLDKQFTANIQAQQSALALATAAYTTAGANGDLAAAAAAATASVEASKAAFIAAQPEADRLSGKANATADALFGIPSETVAKIAETGAANVQTQAGNVTGAVDAIPKNPHVTVTATDNATSVLNNINNYRIADKTFTVFQQSVPVSALEAVHENGGHTYAANGLLYGRGQSQRRTGMGSGVTWAEAATGEEFYLSMKPSMRDRNRSLTAQAAAQLGGQASFGDVRSGSFVPPQVPAQPAFSGTTVNGNQGGVHVGTIVAANPGSVLAELDFAVKRSGL
jgi:hypothetical protein